MQPLIRIAATSFTPYTFFGLLITKIEVLNPENWHSTLIHAKTTLFGGDFLQFFNTNLKTSR